MRQKKRVINFILAFMCCVFVFLGFGIESKAEELQYIQWYEDYKYYPGGTSGNLSYQRIIKYTYDSPDLDKLNHLIYSTGTGINKSYIFWSYDLIDVYANKTEYMYNSNGEQTRKTSNDFSYTDGKYNFSFVLNNGKTVYVYFYGGVSVSESNNNVISELFMYTDFYDINIYNPEPALRYLLENNIIPDVPYEEEFVPDFDNYYHEDTDIWINDMRAGVEEDVLYSTWDGLAGTGVFMLEGYENTYIQVHLTFIDDKGTKSIEDDEYSDMFDFYTELPPNEFSIELSNFEVPEGYRLWLMIAVPYWYFNDDVNSTMFKGKQTYMFFDEDGVSDYPLIKDAADIYNPLDPNLSNWNAITNFTGDYFYNMGNVMNQTFNNWDGSGMGADNVKLNNSLSNFSQEEDAILNSVSDTLNGFEFDNYLSFGDKVTAGVSFGSGLINKFFQVSGDLTILFVVGCVMVFVFIVVGIWRFK